MKDQILSYREMCDQENIQTLQREMNYRLNLNYSVILMSQRKNAPYNDLIYDDGITIEYEGHDVPKTKDTPNPKEIDFQNNNIIEKQLPQRTIIIPTEIKKIVWERDNGKCVICAATNELHFDHDLPYSKGGTSIAAENVRILCARHNLEKSDKIE